MTFTNTQKSVLISTVKLLLVLSIYLHHCIAKCQYLDKDLWGSYCIQVNPQADTYIKRGENIIENFNFDYFQKITFCFTVYFHQRTKADGIRIHDLLSQGARAPGCATEDDGILCSNLCVQIQNSARIVVVDSLCQFVVHN